MINLNYAKKFVGEKVLQQTLNYLAKNPEQNIPKLASLLKQIAINREHKEQIEVLLQSHNQNSNTREYINRVLTEINPYVRQKMVTNYVINNWLIGVPQKKKKIEELGVNIPFIILIDPTSACNLRCEGCWAGAQMKYDTLSYELLDRILTEAKELGIYWIAMSGGEPFVYPYLFEIAEKHNDMAFMIYTNGTLIKDEVADKIVELGNIAPAISLEGWKERTDARRGEGVFDKIVSAMDRLRSRGALFGASLTITRENYKEVTSDEFIDFLINKGAIYGWSFHYIPIGRNPNTNLMLKPEQRAYLIERLNYLRTHNPFMLMDFWNDGEFTKGCIAGGRSYFHITPSGKVAPCAFAQFTCDNIKEKSLLDVLKSPLFSAYQKRQPFCKNHLRPCPIIDNPDVLKEIVKESGARPLYPGAEDVISENSNKILNKKAKEWAEVSNHIWDKKVKKSEAIK
ncbi:MAG TPA: radical SAM protein [Candidatus Atribacteria bacterium]|nr:radical SAM protein [Candidatus Atribacteria bacterium]